MTYNQAVQYLFDSAPMFQNVGAAAYKEGLGGTLALDEHFGHPHRSYRTKALSPIHLQPFFRHKAIV